MRVLMLSLVHNYITSTVPQLMMILRLNCVAPKWSSCYSRVHQISGHFGMQSDIYLHGQLE